MSLRRFSVAPGLGAVRARGLVFCSASTIGGSASSASSAHLLAPPGLPQLDRHPSVAGYHNCATLFNATPALLCAAAATSSSDSAPANTTTGPLASIPFFEFRTEVAEQIAKQYRPANVSVSERCYNNIKRVNRLEGKSCSERFLRLSIESGGCQGFSYKFDFDTEVDDALGRELRNVSAEAGDSDDDEVHDIRFYPPVSSTPEALAEAKDEQAKNVPFVVVDTETLKKLQGATLDYHSELKGSAFVVIGNELVDHSCACAMSFAIRAPGKK